MLVLPFSLRLALCCRIAARARGAALRVRPRGTEPSLLPGAGKPGAKGLARPPAGQGSKTKKKGTDGGMKQIKKNKKQKRKTKSKTIETRLVLKYST